MDLSVKKSKRTIDGLKREKNENISEMFLPTSSIQDWNNRSKLNLKLVGGFNPFEKYWSNWIISAGKGENKKRLKPPPSKGLWFLLYLFQWVTFLLRTSKNTSPKRGFLEHPNSHLKKSRFLHVFLTPGPLLNLPLSRVSRGGKFQVFATVKKKPGCLTFHEILVV